MRRLGVGDSDEVGAAHAGSAGRKDAGTEHVAALLLEPAEGPACLGQQLQHIAVDVWIGSGELQQLFCFGQEFVQLVRCGAGWSPL